MDSLAPHLSHRADGAFRPLRQLPAQVDKEALVAALKGATEIDRKAIARLWLTEGTPVGMAPWVYQWFRELLAAVAEVDCKQVSLVGSYRFGFSLAPHKFGEPVASTSDIDALVVSEPLFCEVANDTLQLGSEELNRERSRGFITTKNIPPGRRSPRVQRMHNCFLRLTSAPCQVKFNANGSSVRIYRDWNAAAQQMSINLKSLLDSVCKDASTR